MGLISRVSSRTYRNFNQILRNPQKIQNGSNARSRQRYGFLSPPIRPKGSQLVQKQGPKIRSRLFHLEASKDGSPTICYRRSLARSNGYFSIQVHHWKQDLANLEG